MNLTAITIPAYTSRVGGRLAITELEHLLLRPDGTDELHRCPHVIVDPSLDTPVAVMPPRRKHADPAAMWALAVPDLSSIDLALSRWLTGNTECAKFMLHLWARDKRDAACRHRGRVRRFIRA